MMTVKKGIQELPVQNKLLDKVFLFLCLFTSIFDTLNGYFLQAVGVNLSVSLLLKLVILTLCFFGLLKYSLFNLIVVVFILFTGVALSYFHMVSTSSGLHGFIVEITHFFKVFSWVIIYLYVSKINWLSLGISLRSYIELVMSIYLIVIMLNISLGIFGIGYSTYSNGFGYKGFLSAGNEVGGALLICFSVLSYSVLSKQKYFTYLLLLLCSFLFSVLLGMKTAILGVVLISFIVLLAFAKENRSFLFSLSLGLLIFGSVVLLFIDIDFEGMFYAYERFQYFLTKDGLLGALLSGREIYVKTVLWDIFFEKNIFDLIFGIGRIGLPYSDSTMEIDFLDILVWFGFIPFLFWLFFLVYGGLSVAKFSLKFKSNYYFVIVWGILILISSMAGHLFISGMTAMLIPFFICYGKSQLSTSKV